MKDLLYKGLMLGRNKKTAREEFLAAAGEKEPAAFCVSESCISEEDVFRDKKEVIHLEITQEGYLEIAAQCEDDIIRAEDPLISTEQAKDGMIEFPFTILADKLHNGKNFARITFKTPYQQISVPVTVNNRIKIRAAKEEPERAYIDLTKSYLDLRMGRIPASQWNESVQKDLGPVNGNTAEDLFFMLYKVHAGLIAQSGEDFESVLEYVSGQLESRQDYSAELFSYFLYIRSLYEKDEALTRACAQTIKSFYEDSPSWQLLWLLFFTDEELSESPKERLDEIKRLFDEGKCQSPIMYFEAYEIFKNDPALICEPSDFAVQVLLFAVKYKISETAPALRLSEVLYEKNDGEFSKAPLKCALVILKDAFDKYPVSSLSNTIARILVFQKSRRYEDHIFFERAVFDFADFPGLFNYYIFTLDKNSLPMLPERVIAYFAKDPAPLLDMRAWFFADLIANRYESFAYKSAYEQAQGQLIAFAYDSAARGINSSLMTAVYAQALQSSKDKDLRRVIFRALFVERLICKNPQMVRALVFHKELKTYSEVILEKDEEGTSSAYVSIYSENSLILFKDQTGNIYADIDHELEEAKDSRKLAKECIKDIPVNALMLIGENLETAKRCIDPDNILIFLKDNIGKSDFTPEYEQKLITDIFEYYRRLPVDTQTYALLMSFLDEDISVRSRAILIEIMIEKKRYNEAADEIKQRGYDEISTDSLAVLTHVLVQLKGSEERDFLNLLSQECLKRDAQDGEIVRYMCRNYDGPLEVLLLLYEKSSQLDIYNLSVAEKILEAAADEQEEPEGLSGIFERCYKESSQRELINAFLEYCARKYLFGGKFKDYGYFDYLGKDLSRGISFSDSAKTGYLLFMSDMPAEPKILKCIRSVLEELVYKGIMLEEFKRYKKSFDIPAVLSNTHIVFVRADKPPKITYKIVSDKVCIEETKPMQEILPGCYAKYFTLLFAESLTYSVEAAKSETVSFSDIEWVRDDSRFSDINEISRRAYSDDKTAFKEALKRYYIKNELIRRLF